MGEGEVTTPCIITGEPISGEVVTTQFPARNKAAVSVSREVHSNHGWCTSQQVYSGHFNRCTVVISTGVQRSYQQFDNGLNDKGLGFLPRKRCKTANITLDVQCSHLEFGSSDGGMQQLPLRCVGQVSPDQLVGVGQEVELIHVMLGRALSHLPSVSTLL